jgi:hypothetical protein
LTSPREQFASFTHVADREADDKVPDATGRGPVPSSRRAIETSMQLPSLTKLKSRFRDHVDDAARGTDVPAGIDRGASAVAPSSSRERGRMRRRLRELRRLREAQLIELGALVLEAHRHGRDDSPVIKTKAAEAAATDAEARAVADALETDAGLDTIVTAGIAGPCPTCGTLTSTAWRFCSTCGTPLDGRPDAGPREVDAVADTPVTDARAVAEPAADSAGYPPPLDAETTELRAPNGNGASADELEATTGNES